MNELQRIADNLLERGLAPTTRRNYERGWLKFKRLAEELGQPALPASESLLCLFVASLSTDLRTKSIENLISGVRSVQIESGLPWPKQDEMPVLRRTLTGLKRIQGASLTKKRMPVTSAMLEKIKPLLDSSHLAQAMLWAAMNTATACLLRMTEAFASREFGNARAPRLSDVVWLPTNGPLSSANGFRLRIRIAKTDQEGVGFAVDCFTPAAVSALKEYLQQRDPATLTASAPLFATQNGVPLHRDTIYKALKTLLPAAMPDLDQSSYNGFSFRAGGATSLKSKKVEDRVIQKLGRWKSTAFATYIDSEMAGDCKRASEQL